MRQTTLPLTWTFSEPDLLISGRKELQQPMAAANCCLYKVIDYRYLSCALPDLPLTTSPYLALNLSHGECRTRGRRSYAEYECPR